MVLLLFGGQETSIYRKSFMILTGGVAELLSTIPDQLTLSVRTQSQVTRCFF